MIDRIDRDLADEEFETHVSVSAGVSSYPEDGSDAETLLEKADDRMSEAKRRKRFLHAA
jgi:GGDEF domain-containing protein